MNGRRRRVTSGGLVRGTLATDAVAKRDDSLESMTGALWSWILAETKKMRGREHVYIRRTTWKKKGRFNLNKRPSCKCHVSFTINDLRPTCQGCERSSKGWVDLSSHNSLKDQIKLSPHGSFQLVIMDPWSEGATKEGENLKWRIYSDGSNGVNKSYQIWTNIRWTYSYRRTDCLNEPVVDEAFVDEPRVDGQKKKKNHMTLN